MYSTDTLNVLIILPADCLTFAGCSFSYSDHSGNYSFHSHGFHSFFLNMSDENYTQHTTSSFTNTLLAFLNVSLLMAS